MSCWVLVPLKARAMAKSRLSSALDTQQRARLVRDMLQHVLGVLRAAEGVDRIVVVSEEADDIPDDIELFVDQHGDLNRSLNDAVIAATERGASQILSLIHI